MEREETFDEVIAEMNYARRLKAAHEREVATLKAALKPVLECDCKRNVREFIIAVLTSQCIYKEMLIERRG